MCLAVKGTDGRPGNVKQGQHLVEDDLGGLVAASGFAQRRGDDHDQFPLMFVASPIGDVAQDCDQIGGCPFGVEDGENVRFDIDGGTVRPVQERGAGPCSVIGEDKMELPAEVQLMLRCGVMQRLADQFRAWTPAEPLIGAVDKLDHACRIGDDDGVDRLFDDGGQTRDGLFRTDAFGEIAQNGEHRGHFTVRVEFGYKPCVDEEGFPVTGVEKLEVAGGSRCHHLGAGHLPGLDYRRVDHRTVVDAGNEREGR